MRIPRTLPGTNYCGLQGRMDLPVLSELDAMCRQHDIDYIRIGGKAYYFSNKADRNFLARIYKTRPQSLVDAVNRLVAFGFFGVKNAVMPVINTPVGSKRVLALSNEGHNLKRLDVASEAMSVMSYDDSVSMEMAAGTPDYLGTMSFNGGSYMNGLKDYVTVKEMLFGSLTSAENEVGMGTLVSKGQRDDLSTYLTEVLTVVPQYDALNAPPSTFVAEFKDFSDTLVDGKYGRLKGCVYNQQFTKFKNNDTTSIHFEVAVYKLKQALPSGTSLLTELIAYQQDIDAVTLTGTKTKSVSLMNNLFRIKNMPSAVRVFHGTKFLKPGQACGFKFVQSWAGHPFGEDAQIPGATTMATWSKNDLVAVLRVVGDLGQSAGGGVGVMGARIDYQTNYTTKFAFDISQDKTQYIRYVEPSYNTSLKNVNPDGFQELQS